MPPRSYAAKIFAGLICALALPSSLALADDCAAPASGQVKLAGTIALRGPGADDSKTMAFTADPGDAAEIVMRDAKGVRTTLSYDRGLIASEPLPSGLALGTPVTLDFAIIHADGDIYGLRPGVTRFSEAVSSDDKPQFQVQIVQTVGVRGRRRIGACAFEVVRRMRVETLDGDAQQRTTEEDYAPSLGFPLWSELTAGGAKLSMEVTSLAAAP
jgi:hypothetical protein